MIDKNSVLKMANHVFKRGQGYPDRRLMHPRREWMFGLLVFLLVVIVGALASAQVYVTYSDTEALVPEANTRIVSYDDLATQNALERFRQRQERFDALTQRVVVFDVVPDTATTTASTTEESGE